MICDALRDDQWERIKDFVPGGRKGKRGPRTNNRLFLDALLWMARPGGRWRDLPERFGGYQCPSSEFLGQERADLRETLAHLVLHVMRPERGAASGDWRWCGV